MSLGRRAKVEAELARELAGAAAALEDVLVDSVFVYLAEENVPCRDKVVAQPVPASFAPAQLAAALRAASARLDGLGDRVAAVLGRGPAEAGQGPSLDLGPLVRLLLGLLEVQRQSRKRDRLPAPVHASFLRALPSVHHWALDRLHWLLCALSAPPVALLPVLARLSAVLAFFPRHPEALEEVRGPYVRLCVWVWSPLGAPLDSLRRALGRPVVEFLHGHWEAFLKGQLEVASTGAGALLQDSLDLCGALLADPAASDVSPGTADALLGVLIEALQALACRRIGGPHDAELQQLAARLVGVVAGATTISIPGYMSPRVPVALRLISTIAFSPGPEAVRRRASEALGAFDLLIHPRRPLPVLLPLAKRVRLASAQADVEVEIAGDGVDGTSAVASGAPVPLTIRHEALQVPKAPRPAPMAEAPLAAEQSPAAPLRLPVSRAPAVAAPVDAEDEDDEPLPALVLD